MIKEVADYDDGFSPTCSVADDGYYHQLGDPQESLLKTALAYQATVHTLPQVLRKFNRV